MALDVRLFSDDVGLMMSLPLSLSVETLGGISTVIIPRDTALPTGRREIFSTAAHNQDSIDVHVLIGERMHAADNVSVGRFSIVDIPPAARGVPKMEIFFAIDETGTFRFSATDMATGRDQPVTSSASLASPLSQSQVMMLRGTKVVGTNVPKP